MCIYQSEYLFAACPTCCNGNGKCTNGKCECDLGFHNGTMDCGKHVNLLMFYIHMY